MGRVDQTSRGSGVFGGFGLETSDVAAFRGDTGDDGNFAFDSPNVGLDKLGLLVGSEESTFPGVTENKDRLDVGETKEELSDTVNGVKIDPALRRERRNSGRGEASHVEANFAGRHMAVTVRVAVGVSAVDGHCGG